MSDKTTIAWTEATWNPTVGCDQISPGCAHCYAKAIHDRRHNVYLASRDAPQYSEPFEVVQVIEKRLTQPLRWRKPRRIFVNSMSDLFHEAVPDSFIDHCFAVMALYPQHTFQILTKRAERMREYFADWRSQRVAAALPTGKEHVGFLITRGVTLSESAPAAPRWPLPNVWLGVSVENQHFADERIPLLLQTPAAVRFVSAEPLLEQVDLDRFTCGECGKSWNRYESTKAMKSCSPCCHHCDEHTYPDNRYWLGRSPSARDTGRGLDWLIAGGESGPQARPCDVAWIRSIVRQCQASGVPCFVKQLGAKPVGWWSNALGPRIGGLCDRKGGDPAEWPADLRVRQYPEAAR